MPKVTFMGTTYECATAVRGSNYIHLVDADGVMVASFEGIVNFDAYSISDGTWTYDSDPTLGGYIVAACSDGVPRRTEIPVRKVRNSGCFTIYKLAIRSDWAWTQMHDSCEVTVNVGLGNGVGPIMKLDARLIDSQDISSDVELIFDTSENLMIRLYRTEPVGIENNIIGNVHFIVFTDITYGDAMVM